LILASASGAQSPNVGSAFNEVIPRTFVPDAFVSAFREASRASMSTEEHVRKVLAEYASGWLESAVRQTVGVLSRQEMTTFDESPRPIVDGIQSRITLTSPNEDWRLCLEIRSSSDDALRLAADVLRREVTLENGGNDLFGELANTLGGRIKAALQPHGFHWKLGLPEVSTLAAGESDNDWDARHWCATATGQSFFTGLRIIRQAGVAPDARAGLAANADGVPKNDEVADVLF
jgi:hypothetical protein